MSESRAEADIPKYVNDFLLYFQVAPGLTVCGKLLEATKPPTTTEWN